MEIHKSDSEEIHQYNIAITRCHEINGCVEEMLFSLKNLQLKFTMPTIKSRKIELQQRASITYPKQLNKSDVQKIEKTILSRRSLHLISQMNNDFILKTIKIKRDFEGSLKQLEFIRAKYDRRIRFYTTHNVIQSVFLRTISSCKCLSRHREK